MGKLAEIESAIASLSPGEFEQLSEWMMDRHLHLVSEDKLESPELEAEILLGAKGPFRPLTEETFERIRRGARNAD